MRISVIIGFFPKQWNKKTTIISNNSNNNNSSLISAIIFNHNLRISRTKDMFKTTTLCKTCSSSKPSNSSSKNLRLYLELIFRLSEFMVKILSKKRIQNRIKPLKSTSISTPNNNNSYSPNNNRTMTLNNACLQCPLKNNKTRTPCK
jgi:hypothetical protein